MSIVILSRQPGNLDKQMNYCDTVVEYLINLTDCLDTQKDSLETKIEYLVAAQMVKTSIQNFLDTQIDNLTKQAV